MDPGQACLGEETCVLRRSSVHALLLHDAADLTTYTADTTIFTSYMAEHLGYIMLHAAVAPLLHV